MDQDQDQDQEGERTRTCGQCHKEVAEVNFSLHEMHCSRFLIVCPLCDDTVPREQLSTHTEEQHTQVRCSKCQQEMQRCHLLDHQAEQCVERLQTCVFCQLELPWKDLADHSLACGSRTELCVDCGRYVQLSQQTLHSLTCSSSHRRAAPPPHTSGPKPRRVRCGVCAVWLSEEDTHTHELECLAAAKRDEDDEDDEEEEDEDLRGAAAPAHHPSRVRSSSRAGPQGPAGFPDRISTCPHCRLALPAATLRWHQAKCQIYILMK